MAWGLASVWYEEIRLRLADPARTVVDCFDSPRLGGGIRHSADILRAYLAEHDGGALIEYGDLLGNGAVFKRLGFILDTGPIEMPVLRRACLDRLSTGIALLDPQGGDEGDRDPTWRLRINARVTTDNPS
jgi:predicted transcriptional regulator of viral defense system